nr:hypothetical protein [uncultured Draconibacterium sp.]
MPEFNKISKKQIQEALRQKKRLGINEVPKQHVVKEKEDVSFLEWYVFQVMNTTPKQFLSNLEIEYNAEQNFRDRRQRNIDFTRARHFNERVWDNELGKFVSQWVYLRRRNIPPLTYNVVSKLNRSLTGQFREINTGNVVKCDSQDERGIELANFLTKCMDRVKKNNKARGKDAMNFQEMMHSGRPVSKTGWGQLRNDKTTDIKFRIVSSDKFIMNPGITDYDLDNFYRGTEIHDGSLNDILQNFAKGDYERGMRIRDAYIRNSGNAMNNPTYSAQSFDGNQSRNNTFHNYTGINGTCRYYESWVEIADYEAVTVDPLEIMSPRSTHKWRPADQVKKEIDQENQRREEMMGDEADPKDYKITFFTEFVPRWYAIFLTPWGEVLDVRESPYRSAQQPFTFTPPGLNGEYWGLIEEVLDAQLSLDRKIHQADSIIDNAAKGIWLIPDVAVPDEFSNKEYVSKFKKADGAVIYKVRSDMTEQHKPTQEYANSANVSSQVQTMIGLFSNLIDEISGNYGAAQGRGDAGGKTATGYALESQNAGLNVRDTMETYLSMLVERDEKILQLIIEGYNKADYYRILGEEIDPAEISTFNFHVEQSKGTNSPTQRWAMEAELLNIVYQGLMPFEVFAEVSTNPVMIQAKQKWEELKKKMATEQQNMPTGGVPEQDVVPVDQKMMVQGTPQADMLQERGVGQKMRKLPGVN